MNETKPVECVINGAHDLLERVERELESGLIDEQQWYAQVAAVITPAYLAGNNPRSQSGYSGDELRWTRARGLIADALDHDGTFLDIGCASGLLMECIQKWSADKGYTVEPFGLDLAPELAELARQRLPHWSDRIHVGNALTWQCERRFDFVRTGLEYVPRRRQRDLVAHLLKNVTAPGGRLIIGTYNERRERRSLEEMVGGWGFEIAGRCERPHRDSRVCYRVIWIDAK